MYNKEYVGSPSKQGSNHFVLQVGRWMTVKGPYVSDIKQCTEQLNHWSTCKKSLFECNLILISHRMICERGKK